MRNYTSTIALIEDNLVFASHMKRCFEGKDIKVESISTNVAEFLESRSIDFQEIQIVLLDINLGKGECGIDGIQKIKTLIPKADVVILSMHDDSKYIFQALCNGAIGFLVKGSDFEDVYQSVKDVLNGGSAMTPSIARKVVEHFAEQKPTSELDDLTSREFDVALAIKDGLSYKLIADKFDISIDSVRFHVKNIYKKLHVNSKSEVVGIFYNRVNNRKF